jgi:hypothetical protein
MRIVHSSVDRLLLRGERSLAVPLIGLILLLIAAGALFSVARSVTLRCERVSPRETSCDVTEKVVGLFVVEQRRIHGVVGAEVTCKKDEDGVRYGAVLLTKTGTIELTPMWLDRDESLRREAGRMNRFVHGEGDPTLDWKLSVTWIAVALVVVLFSFSVWLLLLSRPVRAELDRRIGTLRLSRRSVIGTGQLELPLAAILEVIVETDSDADRPGYCVAVRTKDGRKELLDRSYHESAGAEEAAADAVRAFLASDSGALSEDRLDAQRASYPPPDSRRAR